MNMVYLSAYLIVKQYVLFVLYSFGEFPLIYS